MFAQKNDKKRPLPSEYENNEKSSKRARLGDNNDEREEKHVVVKELILYLPREIRYIIAEKFAQLSNRECFLASDRARVCLNCEHPLKIFTSIEKRTIADRLNSVNTIPKNPKDICYIPNIWLPELVQNICYSSDKLISPNTSEKIDSYYAPDRSVQPIPWNILSVYRDREKYIYDHELPHQILVPLYRCYIDLGCPCRSSLESFKRFVYVYRQDKFEPFRLFWYFLQHSDNQANIVQE